MSRPSGWLLFSLTAGCLFVGCEGSGGNYKSAKDIKADKAAKGLPVHDDHHEHGAAGPHGGAIVELGAEEYHAEVVVDGKTHSLQVYLLGPDAKTAAPVAATTVTVMTEDQKSLELKASPQAGDGDGKASKFELADETAVDALLKAGYLHGSLQIEIAGKPFRGDIDAHFDGAAHDDHAEETKAAPVDEKAATDAAPTEEAPKTDAPKDEAASDQ